MRDAKKKEYGDTPKGYILSLVPREAGRILDVGCGAGATGHELKKEAGREVIGVEIHEPAAEKAADRMDKIILGDIETMDLPYEEYFDCIICADVLEHLHDPWNTLKKLSKYLKSGGHLVASIPNVRYWHVLKNLLFFGEWEYTEGGVLDRTHLRFFTRNGITRLCEGAGFRVELISHIMGLESRIIHMSINKTRLFDRLTLGLFRDFLVFQFLVKARKMESDAE